MKDQVKQIHFVGIGGVGMAGIAEVCLNLGFTVSGSDLKENPTVNRLKSLGALIQIGHAAEHVQDSDVVVVSTAIARDNPEVSFAKESRIPVIPRAAMLAELMRMRFGIAIAGTHGKTTTTSLAAAILTQGGLDPTFVIGGKLNQVDSNARLGGSQYLVAEADESDASFLHLSPMMSVVTNIDEDHMDTYQGDYQNLETTFIEFIHRLPFYGLAILCYEDSNVREMLPKLSRKTRTYGFSDQADVYAANVRHDGLAMLFDVHAENKPVFEVRLNQPGRHNVLNALAAITVGLELDVSVEAIQQALGEFGGVGRRFEVYPHRLIGGKNVTLVDDYGHHPTELSATISTARQAFPNRRLVLVFQPHRYSRTRDLFDDFVQALVEADLVVLTDVYAAGEAPLAAFDSKALLQAMRLRGHKDNLHVESLEELNELMTPVLLGDDVVLVMGAGDIGQVARQWKEQSA
ncbi:UDP-N-acetylmuramate--L-alanine ligase [Hydrogenovibrio thermophilus]|uniref:UDP-N-acetylmuramate--L-alanine ligase n=1 Tax=Hydrogenovibrio thermophilus TaxID=265883 RepID=A0A410H1P0_9GAMM|nr:UDP-N-acetylmuramate--L-alanine ligase [Hydrogenovibrio thermophilus]QAB14814.1 UDP-N-acetylmuramate--L-alanine ligase [Hydrogenovibrio thermophilus]